MTDGSGSTTATYVYDVFGAMRSETGSGAARNEWRFTGEQRDPQGSRNFYYLRARYYDPATGRFVSQDPVPTGNLYAYVRNNPVNVTDPYGLWPCPLCDEAKDLLEQAADKVGDAAECTYNGWTCVPGFDNSFTGPLIERIIKQADVIPIFEVCGRLPVSPWVAATCGLSERAIGFAAAGISLWDVWLNSSCPLEIKLAATVSTGVSLGLDFRVESAAIGEITELGTYYLSGQLTDCKPPSSRPAVTKEGGF